MLWNLLFYSLQGFYFLCLFLFTPMWTTMEQLKILCHKNIFVVRYYFFSSRDISAKTHHTIWETWFYVEGAQCSLKRCKGDRRTAERNGLVVFIVNLLSYVGFIFITTPRAHCTSYLQCLLLYHDWFSILYYRRWNCNVLLTMLLEMNAF